MFGDRVRLLVQRDYARTVFLLYERYTVVAELLSRRRPWNSCSSAQRVACWGTARVVWLAEDSLIFFLHANLVHVLFEFGDSKKPGKLSVLYFIGCFLCMRCYVWFHVCFDCWFGIVRKCIQRLHSFCWVGRFASLPRSVHAPVADIELFSTLQGYQLDFKMTNLSYHPSLEIDWENKVSAAYS